MPGKSAEITAPVGPVTCRAVSPRAKWSRWGASAGVLAGGPRLSKAKAGQAKTSAPVGPMTGQRGFAERNATEREQGPGRERKPRVGKEEGPRFRGADYESPTAYFLSIKKVGKEC